MKKQRRRCGMNSSRRQPRLIRSGSSCLMFFSKFGEESHTPYLSRTNKNTRNRLYTCKTIIGKSSQVPRLIRIEEFSCLMSFCKPLPAIVTAHAHYVTMVTEPPAIICFGGEWFLQNRLYLFLSQQIKLFDNF